MDSSFRATWAVLGVATVAMVSAPVAAAHASLVGSNPSSGARLTSAPTQIELTFDSPVRNTGDRVVITGPLGTARPSTPTVAGTRMRVPFTSEGDGTYEVSWRAVSTDGHPATGAFSFTVGSGRTGATSSGSEHLGVGGRAASASPSTVAGPTTPTTNEPGDNRPGIVFGAVAVSLAGIAGGAVVARRRLTDDPR